MATPHVSMVAANSATTGAIVMCSSLLSHLWSDRHMVPKIAHNGFNVRLRIVVSSHAFFQYAKGLTNQLTSQNRIIGLLSLRCPIEQVQHLVLGSTRIVRIDHPVLLLQQLFLYILHPGSPVALGS